MDRKAGVRMRSESVAVKLVYQSHAGRHLVYGDQRREKEEWPLFATQTSCDLPMADRHNGGMKNEFGAPPCVVGEPI